MHQSSRTSCLTFGRSHRGPAISHRAVVQKDFLFLIYRLFWMRSLLSFKGDYVLGHGMTLLQTKKCEFTHSMYSSVIGWAVRGFGTPTKTKMKLTLFTAQPITRKINGHLYGLGRYLTMTLNLIIRARKQGWFRLYYSLITLSSWEIWNFPVS